MFSKQNTFGASSSGAGFGTFGNTSNTTAFGQSFSKPATFGQTSGFGTQSTGLFGTSQPSTGLFNSGTTNTFGSTSTAQPAFGGFNQPQTSNNLFGSPQQNAQPTLFGQNNTSTFGAQNKPAFGFNQTQPTNSIFGQTTATSSTFGSFGTPQNTSVFGSAGTAFGQANQTANSGTSIAKYQPSIGTDTVIKNGQPNGVSTKQHCITAMKEYENKSIEELRYEDYLANRKGAQNSNIFGQQQTSTGLFGTNPQQGTGLFGQTAENKSVFGTSNTLGSGTAFGQNTGTTFGQNNQNAGGLFSKPFTTPATTNTGFGGFGSTDNAFGAKSAFNTTGGTNLFGQTTTQPTSTFGQTSTFNAFGAGGTQPSLFGNTSAANSSTGFSGFGNTSTTTGPGLFGKPTGFGTNTGFNNPTSSSAFGASTFGTNTGTSLFNTGGLNKPPTSSFGGFGTTQPTTALGTGLNTGNTGSSSLFSNNKPGGLFGTNTLGTGSSMFGGGTLMNNTSTLPSFNSGLNNQTSFLGGQTQQQNIVPVHQQILAMSTLPYGENPIIKDMKLSSNFDTTVLKATNPAAQKAILENSINNFKVQNKISSGIKTKSVADSLTKKSLFDGLESFDNSLADNFKLKSNAKRLIIKPKVDNNQSINNQSFSSNNQSFSIDLQNKENFNNLQKENSLEFSHIESPNDSLINERNMIINSGPKKCSTARESWLNANSLDNSITKLQKSKSDVNSDETLDNSFAINCVSDNSSVFDKSNNQNLSAGQEDKVPNAAGVILNRVGYYMIPAIDELDQYIDDEGNCIVPTLTIGREGYGNVFFNEPIDITNINFDEIVHIRYKQITIYPDDDLKPPQGQGLNREAQVTLDQVWPIDKTLHEPIKDVERLKEMNYETKLRNVCYKQNMRFLEYNPETGSWVFKVKHFSKYGLSDSDEEDDQPDIKKLKTIKEKEKILPIDKTLQKPKNTISDEDLISNKQIQTKLSEIEEDLINSNQSYSQTFQMMVPKDSATDSHKLQLMKASFFIDWNADTDSIMSEKSNESLDQLVPTKIFEKHFSKSTFAELENTLPSPISVDFISKKKEGHTKVFNIIESEPPLPKQSGLYLKPKIAPFKINANVSTLKSTFFSKTTPKQLADTALLMGYRFKASFNSLNSVMFPVKYDFSNEGIDLNSNKFHCSTRLLNQYQVNYPETFEENCCIPHLEIYLEHAIPEQVKSSDCPYFRCGGDLDLLTLHCNASNNKSQFDKIWRLCHSLWGTYEEFEGFDIGSHNVNMCRRNLLSKWFEDEIRENSKYSESRNSNNPVLENLYNHEVDKAANLAFENNEPFQALLISQMSSGEDVRQLVQHQLATWEEYDIDEHIDDDIIKIFMMLSGTQVMATKTRTIDVLENLHWLNVLAIYLWYLMVPTVNIADIVTAYDRVFKSEDFLVVQPRPDHLNYELFKDFENIYDIKYHLLQLFSKRNYSVETIVNPLTYSSNILDYSISWLILQILEVIGFTHCSQLNQEKLHLSFAAQLENCGLWKWSIFILLHINNRDKREMSIQEVLYRNIQLNSGHEYFTEDEKFIINHLGVPEKWINWTKALQAGIQRNFKFQTDLLLKAEQWYLAYKILIQHVVPDAIINGKFNYIRDCLTNIDNNFKVPNWSNEGHILLSYINITNELSFGKLQIVNKDEMKATWDTMNPLISDICSRLNHFPCPTAKHKLCQSEMAQKLTCLIRTFLLSWEDQANTNQVLKMTLGMLPLPQEFLQQELRFLFENIVLNT